MTLVLVIFRRDARDFLACIAHKSLKICERRRLMSRITIPMLKVASSNDRGLLEQAASRDIESKPDELGMCPGQRPS